MASMSGQGPASGNGMPRFSGNSLRPLNADDMSQAISRRLGNKGSNHINGPVPMPNRRTRQTRRSLDPWLPGADTQQTPQGFA